MGIKLDVSYLAQDFIYLLIFFLTSFFLHSHFGSHQFVLCICRSVSVNSFLLVFFLDATYK